MDNLLSFYADVLHIMTGEFKNSYLLSCCNLAYLYGIK
jgi:hypothetical protein